MFDGIALSPLLVMCYYPTDNAVVKQRAEETGTGDRSGDALSQTLV